MSWHVRFDNYFWRTYGDLSCGAGVSEGWCEDERLSIPMCCNNAADNTPVDISAMNLNEEIAVVALKPPDKPLKCD